MAGLFISYRRDDSQGFAGRLAHDLSKVLGDESVFSDIEIPPGSDFSDVLHRAIAASDALLVVMGRRWAAAAGPGQASRLFEPNDWVRTEIEAAFALDKQVIPVLVGGAVMPAADALPPSIQRLPRLQAWTMSDRHWDADLALLLRHLRRLLPALAQAGVPRVPGTAADSPAQALRDIAERVLEEMSARRRTPPPTSRRHAQGLWQALGRRLRGLFSLALLLAGAYVGLRLLGDAQTLAQLDALEARLQVGWQRLLRWVSPR